MDDQPVIITQAQMWKMLTRLDRSVSKLEFLTSPGLDDIRENIDAQNKRLTVVEKAVWTSRWVPVLALAVIPSVISSVLVYIATRTLI